MSLTTLIYRHAMGKPLQGLSGCQRELRAEMPPLNPIRACTIEDPTAYPWSSCANHCGHRPDDILTPHPIPPIPLSAPHRTRAEAYRRLLHETLSDDDLTAIRTYLQQQSVLGKDDFRDMVEAKTRCFAGVRPAHRPPRNNSTAGK